MSDLEADFWCVVMLDDDGFAWIVRRSPDVIAREVLMEFSGEDNGLDAAWSKGKPAGLYRLTLHPWAHREHEGDHDTGVDVTNAEQLYALPDET